MTLPSRRRAAAWLLSLPLLGAPAAAPAAAPPATGGTSAAAPRAPAAPAWVARSNENARVLLEVMTRFSPEGAAQLGVDGFDEQIIDLKPGLEARQRQALGAALAALGARRAGEQDPLVRQDLEILEKAARDNLRGLDLAEKYEVPYLSLAQLVFSGVHALLEDQIPAGRRQAALVRLRRYVGAEPGYQPIGELAMARTRQRLARKGLLPPVRSEVEKDLRDSASYVSGIGELFQRYKIAGYEAPLAQLKQQVARYDAFVRGEVLPVARSDFRLPPEEYAFALERFGVDLPPERLAATAHAAFADIQRQMQALAPEVARARGLAATDYRDVIRALKKEQLAGAAILPHYQARLRDLEQIIRRERLLTLPARPARIRLASEAESAQTPAPYMHPPRLLGNRGEAGEFVLPLAVPMAPGAQRGPQRLDDFTFAAASWTLTAHEARPGHELQFASMVERGVSAARAVFAFNSTNVEGWGLYSEAITLPYMPPEGRLISLQHRLMRAARAFLDPELQLGRTTPEAARRLLMNDVLLSEAMANSEVERYTFRAPGQATSYFYGFTRLQELRQEIEQALGARFDARRFHDLILAEGLLPPALLRKAVRAGLLGG